MSNLEVARAWKDPDFRATLGAAVPDHPAGRIEFALGDILAIYTDGIVEAMNANQEEFGEARLVRTLRENRHLDATSLLDAVMAGVQQFAAGEQSDDLTLLVARAIPGT